MHNIIFYEDNKGDKPVFNFIIELSRQNGKENRLRLKKVLEYIKILETNGKAAGEPYIKHLDGDIWEIRPFKDRILFAGFHKNDFVLLHHFVKKTKKTPQKEIDKAKKELEDFRKRSDIYD